jgi:hypothetical protein
MGKLIKRGFVGAESLNDVVLRHPEVTDAPVNAVAGDVTLTMDTQPTAGDTMTIGEKVYTFTADGTAAADGEIDVGADLADAKTLVVAAINGTDTINTAHPLVTAAAFATDDCTITAITKGTAGNAVVSTETFTAATNVFDTVTLEDGVDGTDALAWETLYASGVLYINASDIDSRGVETDTWRSSTLTLVS